MTCDYNWQDVRPGTGHHSCITLARFDIMAVQDFDRERLMFFLESSQHPAANSSWAEDHNIYTPCDEILAIAFDFPQSWTLHFKPKRGTATIKVMDSQDQQTLFEGNVSSEDYLSLRDLPSEPYADLPISDKFIDKHQPTPPGFLHLEISQDQVYYQHHEYYRIYIARVNWKDYRPIVNVKRTI